MKHLTFTEIVARTAAEKKAGENQTRPQHAGKVGTFQGLAKLPPPTAQPLGLAPVPTSAVAMPVAKIEPCVHRGVAPIRSERCGPCGGKIALKVFSCDVFGECTIGKSVKGVAGCCKGCGSYKA